MTDPRAVALVTGASSGIGRSAAVALANAGFDVVINYSRNETGANETAALAQAAGASTLVYKYDVAEDAEVKAMLAATKGTFGRLDAQSGYWGFRETILRRVRHTAHGGAALFRCPAFRPSPRPLPARNGVLSRSYGGLPRAPRRGVPLHSFSDRAGKRAPPASSGVRGGSLTSLNDWSARLPVRARPKLTQACGEAVNVVAVRRGEVVEAFVDLDRRGRDRRLQASAPQLEHRVAQRPHGAVDRDARCP